jgi:hypothetical protein
LTDHGGYRELPGGAHLAYSCLHEIRARPGVPAEVYVFASKKGDGGGSRWGFSIIEKDLAGPAIKVEVFEDAFAAFTEIPQFFVALARNQPNHMATVYALLRASGAVDETPRVDPSASRRDRLRAGIVNQIEGMFAGGAEVRVGEVADAVLDLFGEDGRHG